MKIRSNRVYIDEIFQPASITINQGIITTIELGNHEADIDYDNRRIFPGFVDVHCHGYLGFDCGRVSKETFIKWIKQLPNEGCTSFLPSGATADESKLFEFFKLVNELKKEEIPGAEILGIYVEGPFISFEKSGAQDRYNILKPNIDTLKKWQKISENNILYNCIAPEVDHGHEMIKWCVENNIVVALGHTNATYDEAISAIKDGAISFTHTYNAMTQLGHRSPGVVGAAFDTDHTYAELIADGIHVHPAAARTLAKMKGKDHLVIVTDSSGWKGYPKGEYQVNGDTVVIGEDGSIRLKDGTLSGSANSMNLLLKNAVENMKIDEVTAINAMTINPCRLLGIHSKGLISVGKDADLVILEDDYSVVQTYCKGNAMV